MIIYQGTTNDVFIYKCRVIALHIKYRDDIIKYQGPTK